MGDVLAVGADGNLAGGKVGGEVRQGRGRSWLSRLVELVGLVELAGLVGLMRRLRLALQLAILLAGWLIARLVRVPVTRLVGVHHVARHVAHLTTPSCNSASSLTLL